jgi:hypothetical protein
MHAKAGAGSWQESEAPELFTGCDVFAREAGAESQTTKMGIFYSQDVMNADVSRSDRRSQEQSIMTMILFRFEIHTSNNHRSNPYKNFFTKNASHLTLKVLTSFTMFPNLS